MSRSGVDKRIAHRLLRSPELANAFIKTHGVNTTGEGRPDTYRVLFYLYNGFGPFTCHYCDEEVAGLEHVHHLDHNPWNNEQSNLAAAHASCHTSSHSHMIRLSEESRQKVSDALKLAYAEGRRTPRVSAGELNPFYGRTHSADTRERLSASAKRRAAEGRHARLGAVLTDETKKKIGDKVRSIPRVWCDECQRDWPPSQWGRHIRKYHEGGKW